MRLYKVALGFLGCGAVGHLVLFISTCKKNVMRQSDKKRMQCVVPSILAWRSFTPQVPPYSRRTYRLDHGFCDDIRRHIGTDILNWRFILCEDVRASVRQGLDAWQHNGGPSFFEVDESEDVLVMARTLHAPTIGTASRSSVVINSAQCWHSDRSFCSFVNEKFVVLHVVLSLLWAASVLSVVTFFVLHPRAV